MWIFNRTCNAIIGLTNLSPTDHAGWRLVGFSLSRYCPINLDGLHNIRLFKNTISISIRLVNILVRDPGAGFLRNMSEIVLVACIQFHAITKMCINSILFQQLMVYRSSLSMRIVCGLDNRKLTW